jgi:hypothetical protein
MHPTNIVIRKDYKTYTIMGSEVNIIYDADGDYAISVAMMDDKLYYLGIEGDSISSAIFAWQENNRELSGAELHQILIDNKLILQTDLQ